MNWPDEPERPQHRWSPDQSVSGTERPEVRITDHAVLMACALVATVAVVAIAVMLATR